jgi:hypothetical protein
MALKMVETEINSIPLTHIHDRPLTLLYIYIYIYTETNNYIYIMLANSFSIKEIMLKTKIFIESI